MNTRSGVHKPVVHQDRESGFESLSNSTPLASVKSRYFRSGTFLFLSPADLLDETQNEYFSDYESCLSGRIIYVNDL